MKTHRPYLFLLSCLLALPFGARAQRYAPTEPWPYLYEEFQGGNIFTNKEEMVGYDQLNVNVINGRLHYVENGTIMEANMLNVHVVRIDKDVYLNVGGRLMRVLRESEHTAVVLGTEVDFEEMNKANIGYGRSSVASTQDVTLSSLAGSDNYGIMSGLLNKTLLDVQKNKYNGKVVPLKETTFLVVDGILFQADRSSIVNHAGVDKKATVDFIKKNKIKFRNPEDLEKLGEYLHTQLTSETNNQ